MMVIVDMGNSNMVPRQAHLIFCLFITARITPRLENPIMKRVAVLVIFGSNASK